MATVAYVLGTRPEVIRSARILQLLDRDADLDLALVNTGQHYDEKMLAGFLRELDVPPPSYDLAVGSADPVSQTATIVARMGEAIAELRPDVVCVFGDTNSTLGCGLAAVKAGCPLVHIEAGCRSYDMRMPEEINRRAVDHIADLLLPVSSYAAANLARESVPGEVQLVGDPQFDIFNERSLPDVPFGERTGGLLTLHRQENADDPARLESILTEIAGADPSVEWTFPVHPRTRKMLSETPPTGIRLVEPLLYGDLLQTLAGSRACVTDSGGLQKEAFWARVPCVTVRETSEWMETVEQGANELAQPGTIDGAVRRALAKRLEREYENPYGDGRSSEKIVEAIRAWIGARALQGAPAR